MFSIKVNDDSAQRLQHIDLVCEAAKYLRKGPYLPVAILLREYGVRRLDHMTNDQLKEFIERAKAGKLS